MTSLKPASRGLLLALVIAAALVISLQAQEEAPPRQVQNERARSQPRRPAVSPANQLHASMQSGATASAAAAAATSVSGASLAPAGFEMGAPSTRPGAVGRGQSGGPSRARPQAGNAVAADQEDEVDQRMEPAAPPPRRRSRPARPATRPSGYDEEAGEEDCDEYGRAYGPEFDYGNMFRAAFRPMRQLGDMMGSMFEQMQGLASGDYQELPAGANYAAASARSTGDGYSKFASIVNNNGRRRGVVSETRNGRTQTRRIGDDDEEEE